MMADECPKSVRRSPDIPSIAQLCQLYVDGWTYIESSAPAAAFAAGDKERIAFLKALAGQVITLEQLSAIVELGANMAVANFGYKPVQPLTSSNPMVLGQTCFQFGVGRLGWYFAKASHKTWAFSWILFRTEIAPPAVVAQSGIPPQHAVLYSLTGGAGLFKRGAWHSVPRNVFQAQLFVCEDRSMPDHGGNFSVRFESASNEHDVHCTIDMNAFQSVNLSACFPIAYLEDAEKSKKLLFHSRPDTDGRRVYFQSSLGTSNGTSPVYNGPYGCLPCGKDGSGSSYWSMTDMTGIGEYFELGASQVVPQQPAGKKDLGEKLLMKHGWFDHQWVNTALTPLPSGAVTRWLWLPIQLDGNRRQYMISVIFPPNDTSLENGVRKGAVYDATFVNRYTSGDFVDGWDHEYDRSTKCDVNDACYMGLTAGYKLSAPKMQLDDQTGQWFLPHPETQQTFMNQTLATAQVTIVETTEFRGSTYPTAIHIALTEQCLPNNRSYFTVTDPTLDRDGEKTHHLLLVNAFHKTHGQTIVFLPSGVWNWEGPADLYDLSPLVKGNRMQVLRNTGTKLNLKRLEKIGGGFIEANQMVTASQIVRTQAAPLVDQGLATTDDIASLFEPKIIVGTTNADRGPQETPKASSTASMGIETLALILVLILALVLIVLAVWWTVQRVQKGQGAIADDAGDDQLEEDGDLVDWTPVLE
jgi:hypothetical protein